MNNQPNDFERAGYSCVEKSLIPQIENQSSGAQKSTILYLIICPFCWNIGQNFATSVICVVVFIDVPTEIVI